MNKNLPHNLCVTKFFPGCLPGLLSGLLRFRFHTQSEDDPAGAESMDISTAEDSPADARLAGTVPGAWVNAFEGVGGQGDVAVRAGTVLVSAQWRSTPAELIEVQVRRSV
jgi:hypothetical protein